MVSDLSRSATRPSLIQNVELPIVSIALTAFEICNASGLFSTEEFQAYDPLLDEKRLKIRLKCEYQRVSDSETRENVFPPIFFFASWSNTRWLGKFPYKDTTDLDWFGIAIAVWCVNTLFPAEPAVLLHYRIKMTKQAGSISRGETGNRGNTSARRVISRSILLLISLTSVQGARILVDLFQFLMKKLKDGHHEVFVVFRLSRAYLSTISMPSFFMRFGHL